MSPYILISVILTGVLLFFGTGASAVYDGPAIPCRSQVHYISNCQAKKNSLCGSGYEINVLCAATKKKYTACCSNEFTKLRKCKSYLNHFHTLLLFLYFLISCIFGPGCTVGSKSFPGKRGSRFRGSSPMRWRRPGY